MRKCRLFKMLAVLTAAFIVMGNIQTLPVQAGLGENMRDASTFQEGIDDTVWFDANKDIVAENGVIIFPETSDADTKLIAKTPAKWDESLATLVKVEADYQFTQLPAGEKFILGFGLSSIEAEAGESGNIEIAFENTGGLQVSVTVYTEEGEAVELLAPRNAGSMANVHVSAEINGKSQLNLSVDGTRLYSGDLPMNGAGRIGFLQTGSCAVKISNIEAATYQYDRPENSNIYEDFEQGGFNKNLLTSKTSFRIFADTESVLGIEDMDGNKVFRFLAHNTGYLGTVMEYSNFEMTFDIPYMARQSELDDEGNVLEHENGQFLVAFGGEAKSLTETWGYETCAEYIVFREFNAFATMSGVEGVMPESHQVYNAENDRGWSARIRVVDGKVQVFLKWIEETQWTEALAYDLPTPTGYIQIWQGNNMAIDNLSIINLDDNPSLLEVSYESSLIEVPEDFDYQPMERIYEKEEPKESGFNWILLIPATVGVCVVGLGIVLLIVTVKKKKRKDGGGHEA